ncbi:hypothetical protein [Caballeronia arvi]|uniref:hypothetical protein n=1 Tax=Caballeronia arvi TaxID=1777135 RepID=UPI0038993F6D
MPRVYLGLHYPTDFIGGAAIGAFYAWPLTRTPIRGRFVPLFVRFMEYWLAVGYMLAFLFERVGMGKFHGLSFNGEEAIVAAGSPHAPRDISARGIPRR